MANASGLSCSDFGVGSSGPPAGGDEGGVGRELLEIVDTVEEREDGPRLEDGEPETESAASPSVPPLRSAAA